MIELKKIFIALAGPVINIIISIIFFNINILNNIKQEIIYANILIAIFNFIPIYPLDGGRILKGILHIWFGKWKAKKYINEISIISAIILTAIASVGIYYFKNISILAIIVYLWIIVIKQHYKYLKEVDIYNVIKTIENK